MIKIKETIERSCCQQKDLKPYKGTIRSYYYGTGVYFCEYCGQLWKEIAYTDEAGSKDTRLVEIEL